MNKGARPAGASRLYGATQGHRPKPESTDQTGQRRRI